MLIVVHPLLHVKTFIKGDDEVTVLVGLEENFAFCVVPTDT